jgi:hypothetical protein
VKVYRKASKLRVGRREASCCQVPAFKCEPICTEIQTISGEWGTGWNAKTNLGVLEVDVQSKHVRNRHALSKESVPGRPTWNQDLPACGEVELPPNERCETPTRSHAATQQGPPRGRARQPSTMRVRRARHARACRSVGATREGGGKQ